MGIELEWLPPQGWECPKCGHVYSPMTPMCWYCGGSTKTTTTTDTGTSMQYHCNCKNCGRDYWTDKAFPVCPFCGEQKR